MDIFKRRKLSLPTEDTIEKCPFRDTRSNSSQCVTAIMVSKIFLFPLPFSTFHDFSRNKNSTGFQIPRHPVNQRCYLARVCILKFHHGSIFFGVLDPTCISIRRHERTKPTKCILNRRWLERTEPNVIHFKWGSRVHSHFLFFWCYDERQKPKEIMQF